MADAAVRRTKRRQGATAVAIVALACFAVSLGDEIAGRIYFNHLCANNAGIKIHATVELPAQYWDGGGTPTFFNKEGYLEREFSRRELDGSGGSTQRYSGVLAIDKATSLIKQRASQKLLAEVTTFLHWGGWLNRSLSLHNSARSCEFMSDPNFSRKLYGEIFRPAK